MSDNELSFEVGASFEAGEVSGNVRLGKFESYYEGLFAEVIEDGIITAQERQRLDMAADTLGLDRNRLRKLEEALQAAYEARHQVIIREVESLDDAPRASLAPLEPATDQRTLALERRVKFLEARVAELEHELEDARTHVPIEVDLSSFEREPTTAVVDDDPVELQRRLRGDPRDLESLHALYRSAAKSGDLDKKWCVAHALSFLNAANDDEKRCFQDHRSDTLIRPSSALSRDGWLRLLFHPEEEVLTGEIFSVVIPAVLLGRVSALRRDKLLPHLDPQRKQKPATSTLQSVRCFTWAAAILGMQSPSLYADPTSPATLEMVPGLPPATRIGKLALSGRSANELAFLAGRHLSYYREEHFVRILLPAVSDLEDIFLAALSIGNPGLPLSSQIKNRVLPIARAIEPILEPSAVDRLRGNFLRFVEEGARTNLQRWASAVDRTANRGGLLLCNDLRAAQSMLAIESPAQLDERIDDLLTFVVSDRYSKLRRQVGIAISN
jgi:hypothetical protein